MSRLVNFSKNLGASYIQLVCNVIYSVVSIPLILHYLPKEQFGLWATLMQLIGYFSLIDFGMTSASSRLLVDHKDDRSTAKYGSLIQTTALVSCIQGSTVFVVCLASSPFLGRFIKVPAEQLHLFQQLFIIQGAIAASGFVFRPLGVILYAHQKEYVPILVGAAGLAISLPLLWAMLALGVCIYSFVYSALLIAIISPLAQLHSCWRYGYLPQGEEWGKITKANFEHVFNYGKDIFLLTIGGQLATASQLIIISRCLGLSAAAAWAVGTKMFNLIIPLMSRPFGAAIPGMSEMFVRGEQELLYRRFREILVLTSSLGVFLGVSYALCNSTFVDLWTHGKIFWLPINDTLIGASVILYSMQTTHVYFVSVTKQIGGMKYIYLAEGICFVSVALAVTPYYGVKGIIVSSLASTFLFSYQYSIMRTAKYFSESSFKISITWIIPTLKYAFLFIPLTIILGYLTDHIDTLPRLVLRGTFSVIFGVSLLLTIGLSKNTHRYINEYIKLFISRLKC